MYVVQWSHSATNSLAAICLLHLHDWPAIDAAEQDISEKLERDPIHCSQEVSEGLRRIISRPLVAFFSIDGNRAVVDGVNWIG
jgi:hypothetical protein